ncbi:hypothetical protein N566_03245, partial [Streptomycetaceae bacterium MP113-05]
MTEMKRDEVGEDGVEWRLVVPLKPLARAKSRLGATAGDAVRPGLALAFAQDTVSAALACRAVRGVVVVTDDPVATAALEALGADTVRDVPARGLNAALAHGVAAVRSGPAGPAVPVAALGADLPALRPEELGRVLAAAAVHQRAFLADAAGVGTTLLSALPDSELAPAFGDDSRDRHLASGAVELTTAALGGTDVAGVRRDV